MYDNVTPLLVHLADLLYYNGIATDCIVWPNDWLWCLKEFKEVFIHSFFVISLTTYEITCVQYTSHELCYLCCIFNHKILLVGKDHVYVELFLYWDKSPWHIFTRTLWRCAFACFWGENKSNRTGHCQTGSLAGVAHPLEWNTDVPRAAPWEQKPLLDYKEKSCFDLRTFSTGTQCQFNVNLQKGFNPLFILYFVLTEGLAIL